MNQIQTSTKQRLFKRSKPSFGNKSVITRELEDPRALWLWVSIALATILILYFSLQLALTTQKWVRLQNDRAQLTSKMNLWQGIIGQYPNYRDAYFEAAVLAYRLGDTKKTSELLQKLALIDQNFPYAKKLEMLNGIVGNR